MNEKLNAKKKCALWLALLFVVLAGILTALICTVDVRAIGPASSEVGLSRLNEFFFNTIGTHRFWYLLTEGLGVFSILIGLAFAVTALVQWIKRKSLRQIDGEIWGLAGVYAVLAVLYVLFEKVVINCRPIIEEGETAAEASFPSSHTLLTVAVIGTAVVALRKYLKKRTHVRNFVTVVGSVLIVIAAAGRLLSGVHWFTDILAGVLIAAAIIFAYDALVIRITIDEKEKKRRRAAARKK